MKRLGLILLAVVVFGCSISDDDSTRVDLPTEPPTPVLIQPAGLCLAGSGLSIQCSDESRCVLGLEPIACDSVIWERFDAGGVFVDSLTGGPGERVQFDAVEPGSYRVQQTINARDAQPVALQHNVTVIGG